MKIRPRTLVNALLPMLLGACGLRVEVKCGESGFNKNKSNGHEYAWSDGISLQYRFADNVPDELRESITEGAKAYNEALAKTRITFLDKYAPPQKGNSNEVSGDGINGIYIVSEKDWFFYKSNPGAVAVTNNIYTTNEIIETDIFFLVKELPETEVARAPSSTIEDLQIAASKFGFQVLGGLNLMGQKSMHEHSLGGAAATARGMHEHSLGGAAATARGMTESEYDALKPSAFTVHEMGHSLGLCHNDNSESIMQPEVYTSKYRNKPFLSDFDLEMLSAHYEIRESDEEE